MEPVFILVWGLIGLCVVWEFLKFCAWRDKCNFRAYAREWCIQKVTEDEVAVTNAGIEAMVDYICKKMDGRTDRWECELYISPSVYKRIANEYRPKEW